jgi:hypothetical protein
MKESALGRLVVKVKAPGSEPTLSSWAELGVVRLKAKYLGPGIVLFVESGCQKGLLQAPGIVDELATADATCASLTRPSILSPLFWDAVEVWVDLLSHLVLWFM